MVARAYNPGKMGEYLDVLCHYRLAAIGIGTLDRICNDDAELLIERLCEIASYIVVLDHFFDLRLYH